MFGNSRTRCSVTCYRQHPFVKSGAKFVSDLAIGFRRQSSAFRAGSAALILLALTTVHHAYGAVVFATPWRLHVLVIVLPVAIAIIVALRQGATMPNRSARRVSTILAALLILLVPVAAIGLFEGGYNHVLKNLVYFVSGEAEARALFPPPLYEMPHDLFFEATGIAQFPLSLATAVLALRLFREPVL
jgi:hypothetical protein